MHYCVSKCLNISSTKNNLPENILMKPASMQKRLIVENGDAFSGF